VRLSKDDILKAEDRPAEEVEVREWGGSVLVRGMTGRERDALEASLTEYRGKDVVPSLHNIRARVVAACVIGDDGKPLFGITDVEALGEKSAAPLNRVYEVAARLSGLSEGDVEGMAGNFSGTGSGPSPSAWPSGSA
jgi:hypothetical protein